MDFSRRQFLKATGLGLAASAFPGCLMGAASERRPNILLVLADDWGWGHAGVLGDPCVKTPNFDRVAREGVLFTRAYCAAPTCTASRASLLTGQMFYRLEQSAFLHGPLDKKFRVYPDLLEAAGYAVGHADKGWGPGDFKAGGRTRNPAGPKFQNFATFLAERKAGQPFCFWFGSNNPHRPYNQTWLKGTVDPAKVRLPAFLPDAPEVRADVADYLAEVQAFDKELGHALDALGDQLDNTLVVVTSDNGMPFPRGKLNLYDSGTRMPMAIRGPGMRGGKVVDEFVSLCDLAPTFLGLAGLPIPAEMTGRSLLQPAKRESVVVGRERHAGSYYPCRALHTREFLYIRNYHPDGSPRGADPGPTVDYMESHQDKCYELYAANRPAEELYDNRSDPDQLVNVGADPKYADVKARLARELDDYLKRTGDPRAAGRGAMFDEYPNFSERKPGQPG